MASCITSQWSSNAPQIELTVTESSYTNTTSTLSYTLKYKATYAASASSARSYSIGINGKTVKSGTYSISGKTGTNTIVSGTVTINKLTYKQSISFSCSMAFNLTWGGSYAGTKSASGSISIGPKASYTIAYNANGGTGAPGNQTKWAGVDITLSSSRPSRTGYQFLGWSKSSGGAVAFQPSSTYSSDASVTLYAVWKANTYTISYNANGGTGAPGNQIKTYGINSILSSVIPTKTNYNFKGWGTSASSTTVAYSAGSTYTNNSSITLYAIWELAYVAPRINNFTVDRCNIDGVSSEEGTYALVVFEWECDREVTSIKIEYKTSISETYKEIAVSASGISGSVNEIIGSDLSTEHTYNIRITITDELGSTNLTKNVAPIAFDMDFLQGGGGVAIGKPAVRKGFEIAMVSRFENDMYDKFGGKINNGLASYDENQIDANEAIDDLILTSKNSPVSDKLMYIHTIFYEEKSSTAIRTQYAFPYLNGDSMYHRCYYNGNWSPWKRYINDDEINTQSGNITCISGDILNWSKTGKQVTLSIEGKMNRIPYTAAWNGYNLTTLPEELRPLSKIFSILIVDGSYSGWQPNFIFGVDTKGNITLNARAMDMDWASLSSGHGYFASISYSVK